MKKANVPTCPGCSRHCTACNVRCKYGRAYFQRHMPELLNSCSDRKKHKWERFVTEGELLWTLLNESKRLKKALCHQKVTESGLLSMLSDEEKAALASALRKLGTTAEAACRK